jgi:hypothetical protein
LNDYSFTSAPQLKRDPLDSRVRVSLFTQSLIRWVLMAGIVVALTVNQSSSAAVDWVLWISLAVLFLSAFFWPRCRHCGARVVQFNKREWFAGEACWRCGKPYDETRTPVYALEMDRALDEALKVRKKDPAAFEQLLREAERRYETSYEAEKTTLREHARFSAVAAKTLRNRLKSELTGLIKMQKVLRKSLEADPSVREGLRNIEAETRSVESELASIEAMLPLLSNNRDVNSSDDR